MHEFQALLYEKGRELYRDMPWREDTRAFYVLVSELMLQQTQVERVIPKFEAFIKQFPDVESLARAPLSEVLILWSGLGYNRRAKYLHDAAKKIVHDFNNVFPSTRDGLMSLPGVGPGTAGAILAYTFNQPVVFIETNVRTVYFHHFFHDREAVSDTEILKKLKQTVPWGEGKEQPEQRIYSAPGAMNGVPAKSVLRGDSAVGLSYEPKVFYWALMDYGAWLKKNGAGRITQSHHYKKQSPLKGSSREVRGQIVKALSLGDKTVKELQKELSADERFEPALAGLLKDGLVKQTDTIFYLTK